MFKRIHSWWPSLTIISAVTLAHWPLLIMDATFWDDWVLKQFILDNNPQGHFILWEELGLPGFAPIYWAIGSLGGDPVIAHNLVTFSLLIISSLLVYRLARTAGEYTQLESVIVAVTSGVYAALETTFVFNVTVYLLMLTLLLAGANVAMAAKQSAGATRIVLRLMALVLFFVSFQHNSLLVFYGGFVFMLWLQARRHESLGFMSCCRKFLLENWDYLLLPVAFWTTKQFTSESVAYYNRFNVTFTNLWSGIQAYADKGIAAELSDIARLVAGHPLIWITATAITLVLLFRAKPATDALISRQNRTVLTILFGLLLLLLAIAPYILVSKATRGHGYTTRHALLIAIPLGILLMGIMRPLLQRRWTQWIAIICLTTGLTGSILAHWEVHHRWQTRWVKDRSLMTYLADHPELKSVGTFVIDDQFNPTVETYRYYEWGAMMRHAWDEPGHLGHYPDESYEDIAKVAEYHPHWMEWYHLAGYEPDGCSAVLKIEPRGEATNAELSQEYTRLRLFGNDEAMQDFLRQASVISVQKDKATCT